MRQTSATQRKETASKSSVLALTGERQAVAKRPPVGEPGKGAAQVIFTVLPTMSPRNHAIVGFVHTMWVELCTLHSSLLTWPGWEEMGEGYLGGLWAGAEAWAQRR